jgi:hypothetical protein
VSGNSSKDQLAFFSERDFRSEGRDVMCGPHRMALVAARRQTGRLPGSVDAPHLHRHRGEPGHAEHQNDHQRGDGEGRLDGGGAAIIGQTLVFNARLMTFVSAVTIESPVTTV